MTDSERIAELEEQVRVLQAVIIRMNALPIADIDAGEALSKPKIIAYVKARSQRLLRHSHRSRVA